MERAERRRARASAAGKDTSALDRALAEYATAATRINGTRTVNKAIATLRAMLKFAEGRRMVAFNAAAHVRMLPKKTRSDLPLDHACLTPAEIMQLVKAIHPDWRAAVMVLAYGGLRLGEALGLCWGDVEFGRNRILVSR